MVTAPLKRCRNPPTQTRQPADHVWQPMMFEDGILMVELSVTWHDSQHSTLALTRLDGWFERSNSIIWLVMLSLSTYPMIILTVFFKFIGLVTKT